MGELIEFKSLPAVGSVFDGWTRQCWDDTTDWNGGRDVWGFLIDKYGRPARDTTFLVALLGPFTEWLQQRLDLAPEFKYHNIKRSLTFIYGPEAFPLNVLLYANDHLRLTPEEFRSLELEFQFEVEDKQEGNEFNSNT